MIYLLWLYAIWWVGLWSWGRNQNGQLGLGCTDDCNMPQKVLAFQGIVVTMLPVGAEHTVAVTESGSLGCLPYLAYTINGWYEITSIGNRFLQFTAAMLQTTCLITGYPNTIIYRSSGIRLLWFLPLFEPTGQLVTGPGKAFPQPQHFQFHRQQNRYSLHIHKQENALFTKINDTIGL